ncbi:SH3 domain-containing protein [Xylanibacillus composti]|nr:hypothetical protein [Xylanibacillus composti]
MFFLSTNVTLSFFVEICRRKNLPLYLTMEIIYPSTRSMIILIREFSGWFNGFEDFPQRRKMPIAKFELGQIVVTPGVLGKVNEVDQMKALNRHAQCDWGTISCNDVLSNENALKTGERLFSAYTSESGIKFWIITEADRSATTLLLPEEY